MPNLAADQPAGTALQPQLARHTRLVFDRMRGRHLLLAPESVSALNPTGAAILQLCDGQRTVAQLTAALGRQYGHVDAGDVRRFIDAQVAARHLELR